MRPQNEEFVVFTLVPFRMIAFLRLFTCTEEVAHDEVHVVPDPESGRVLSVNTTLT